MEKRKPNRLDNYDYSSQGAYFITVCAKDRAQIFSRIVGGGILDAPNVELLPAGKIVDETINTYCSLHEDVYLDKYVIMPNHIHMIVVIGAPSGASGKPPPTNAVIPKMISSVKRFADRSFGTALFQRGYYDHIIRDENDYLVKAKYILDNPFKWADDEYYVN